MVNGDDYEIWAPKRFVGKGRYSDTDLIRYDKVHAAKEIEFHDKSDFPAKEVLTPITETLFYFTDDEYRESKAVKKKILIFMQPCDIHAKYHYHQEKIYLQNDEFEDSYYKRILPDRGLYRYGGGNFLQTAGIGSNAV